MIDIDLPHEWLWALRWALFLGPLAAVLLLGARHRHEPRVIVGEPHARSMKRCAMPGGGTKQRFSFPNQR